jgi:hypothetical protein
VAAGRSADQRAEQRTACGAADHLATLLLWGRTVRHLFGERDRIDPGGLLRPRVAFRRIGLLALDTLAKSFATSCPLE